MASLHLVEGGFFIFPKKTLKKILLLSSLARFCKHIKKSNQFMMRDVFTRVQE